MSTRSLIGCEVVSFVQYTAVLLQYPRIIPLGLPHQWQTQPFGFDQSVLYKVFYVKSIFQLLLGVDSISEF